KTLLRLEEEGQCKVTHPGTGTRYKVVSEEAGVKGQHQLMRAAESGLAQRARELLRPGEKCRLAPTLQELADSLPGAMPPLTRWTLAFAVVTKLDHERVYKLQTYGPFVPGASEPEEWICAWPAVGCVRPPRGAGPPAPASGGAGTPLPRPN